MKKLLLTSLISGAVALNLYAEKLIVGATPVPHAEIIELIKSDLEAKGYEIEIKEFNDYIIPALTLEAGEIDFNFSIGLPYMKELNKTKGTHMVNLTGVHIEPLGIYSDKFKSLDELKSGAKVTLPNDVSTETRSLKLLEKAGLIKLAKSDAEFLTTLDVIENPKKLNFITLEPASLPRSIKDTDIAIINANYALEAGLNPKKDSIFLEDKDSPYLNVLIVKEGDENLQSSKDFKEAITSDKVRKFIEEKYSGAVIPAF